jgi:nitrogen regulatory protein P-II 1
MKQITAIIRPEKLPEVTKALTEAGIGGMTITEVKGRGNQKGIVLQTRGGSHEVSFLEKIQIMIVVADDQLECVLEAIMNSAQTNFGPGDGKIFVSNVEEIIRIRTQERNGVSCI